MKSNSDSHLKKTNFKNGLRLLTIPQKGTKAVTVFVLVGTGSKNEHKKINGVSHFLEHMFFKGTTKRPTALEVIEPLDNIGGAYNAFTGEEFTGYYAKVSGENLDLALEWVADIFLNSTLPAKEIKKEKGVIIEELNMHNDIPMSRVETLWDKLLYGDQPAGWDIAGTQESVLGLQRRDLVKYMESQYVASNTVVCVAGNIKENEVEAKVAKLFSGISKGAFQKRELTVEKQDKPEVLVQYRKTDQTHIACGVRGYSLSHPQRYSQMLLATMLGGMMSSRLWIEVRERLGLAYSISTVSRHDVDTGVLLTKAGVTNSGAEKAVRVIVREYRRIAQKDVPEQELKKAKDHAKGELALELEPSDEKAYFYGLQELLEENVLTLDQVYDKIDAVSVEDICSAARELFCPERLNLVVLGPFAKKAPFQDILNTLKP